MQGEYGECAICFDDVTAGQNILTTECNHTYHYQCFQRWVDASESDTVVCPICRTNLNVDIEEDEVAMPNEENLIHHPHHFEGSHSIRMFDLDYILWRYCRMHLIISLFGIVNCVWAWRILVCDDSSRDVATIAMVLCILAFSTLKSAMLSLSESRNLGAVIMMVKMYYILLNCAFVSVAFMFSPVPVCSVKAWNGTPSGRYFISAVTAATVMQWMWIGLGMLLYSRPVQQQVR